MSHSNSKHRSCCTKWISWITANSQTTLYILALLLNLLFCDFFVLMATSDKYDRQLRLWGSDGQRALMDAHILLVGADAAGTETLKNLVLPGVGRFTVMDDQPVTAADCGSNFFVTHDNIGQSRAVVVTGMLCEMNSDVVGVPIILNAEETIESITGHIRSSNFTTVILSNPSTPLLQAVSLLCWELHTPLVVIRTCGLLGYMRLQLREQYVIASASDLYDLRIFNPFPELHEYCCSFNLSTLSDIEHAHVPYIVILYQALQKWKEEHNGSVPTTYVDKKAFAGQVQAMSRNRNTEVNFEEALNNSFRSYAPIRLPEQIAELLQNIGNTPAHGASEFRILLMALQGFMEKHDGNVPIPGNIPDMTSTSDGFIQLQQRYHAKAEADREDFRSIVSSIVEQLGHGGVSNVNVDMFCRSVYALGFVDSACPIVGSASVAETTEPERLSNSIQQYFGDLYEDVEQTPIVWWFLIMAAELFESRNGRWPGVCPDNEATTLETDAQQLWQCVHSVVVEKVPPPPRPPAPPSGTSPRDPVIELRPILGPADSSELTTHSLAPGPAVSPECPDITMKHCREMVRFGNSSLHNIASVIGGVASQEVAKIITHKFMPVNNTFIFNGICGVASTYEL